MNTFQTVHDLLASLGFEPEACQIYDALWTNGPQSISELSRSSNVERTKVYRILPILKSAHLIASDTEYSSDNIHITSVDHLQDLLHKQQDTLRSAQFALPTIIANRQNIPVSESRVNVYRGSDGIKQLLWNETNATTEIISVLQEPIQSKTSSAFFERWVAKCNQRDLRMRGVVGDVFSQSRDKWYATHVNEQLANWQGRHIDKDIFAIDQNMVIYDDVVAYFNWNLREFFGIEIHSAPIAATQRQFFELLWNAAK